MADKPNDATRILKLGVDEMFEDLTYNVAYDVVLKKLKDNGMDDGILKQAMDSGITIMFSSALMLYIQKQEQILEKILLAVISVIGLILNPLLKRTKQLLKRFKGRAASMFGEFFGISSDERLQYANLAVNIGNSVIQSQQSNSQNSFYADNSLKQREILMHSKDQQLAYAKAKADSFNQTLLFKLLTSKFTATDKELLRRITGSNSIDIDNINKVSEFMWVKDDAGNITGLSEAFMTMLNGLGYFSGKDKKHP